MWELSATEAEAIGLSLKVALWAVLVSLPLGIFAAVMTMLCSTFSHSEGAWTRVLGAWKLPATT